MFVLPEFRKEKPALHDPDGLGIRLADALVHRPAHNRQILCRVRLGRHLVEGVAVVEVVSAELLSVCNKTSRLTLIFLKKLKIQSSTFVYSSTKAFPIWTNMGSSGSRRYVALKLEEIGWFNYNI